MQMIKAGFHWRVLAVAVGTVMLLATMSLTGSIASDEARMAKHHKHQGGKMQDDSSQSKNGGGTMPMQRQQMMEQRVQMQNTLEKQLQTVKKASGEKRVDAMVDLLESLVEQHGKTVQHMQKMHQKMEGNGTMDPQGMQDEKGSGMQRRYHQKEHNSESDNS